MVAKSMWFFLFVFFPSLLMSQNKILVECIDRDTNLRISPDKLKNCVLYLIKNNDEVLNMGPVKGCVFALEDDLADGFLLKLDVKEGYYYGDEYYFNEIKDNNNKFPLVSKRKYMAMLMEIEEYSQEEFEEIACRKDSVFKVGMDINRLLAYNSGQRVILNPEAHTYEQVVENYIAQNSVSRDSLAFSLNSDARQITLAYMVNEVSLMESIDNPDDNKLLKTLYSALGSYFDIEEPWIYNSSLETIEPSLFLKEAIMSYKRQNDFNDIDYEINREFLNSLSGLRSIDNKLDFDDLFDNILLYLFVRDINMVNDSEMMRESTEGWR